MQTILPTSNGAAVKLTTARYYTPSGRSIQAEGIEPDIALANVKLESLDKSEFDPVKEANLSHHLQNGNLKPKMPEPSANGESEKPKDGSGNADADYYKDYPL